jgi:hypothetical protein
VPIEEQQKNALVNNFTLLVRQTQTPGVEVQKLSIAFRMAIDAIEPDQPIDLESLFQYLTQEQKVAEKDVLELCVILKSREDKLNVRFTPPAKAAWMSAQQIEKIVNAFNARVDKAWDKRAPEAAKPAGGSSNTTTKQWQPVKSKKGAGPRSKTPFYVGGLIATIIAFFAFEGWYQSTKVAPLTEQPPPQVTGGLPCQKWETDGKTSICWVPKAVWDRGPEATLKTQATQTKNGTRAQVPGLLFVRVIETGKIVMTIR